MSQSATVVRPRISYAEVLGKIVEHRRRELGLIQAPFAQALGITQSGYSRIEKGQTVMSVVQLQIVARLLGRTSADLLSDAEHYASLLRDKGAEIVEDKKEVPPAGLLIALGLLVALLASSS